MAADLKTLKAECTQHCQSNTTLQNTYTQVNIHTHCSIKLFHKLCAAQVSEPELVKIIRLFID